MSEMRTEEEQIQAIKDWWKKNGSSLLIGIGAALAIVFGWQAWQNHQSNQRTQAASQFADLINAYSDTSDDKRADTVSYLADKLSGDFEDSAYATYGMLILARQQMMEQDDPEAAIKSLQWAQSHGAERGPLSLVVINRLAQAQFAAGQLDEALATIEGAKNPGSFQALFAELKGDILVAKGDRSAAREAYLAAREASGNDRYGVLDLKLADLGVGEGA